jgi:hypothetical protein
MNERKQRLLSVVEVLASMVRTIQLRRTFSAVSPTPTFGHVACNLRESH